MTTFVKLDGKWFNPEHIMMVAKSPSRYPGFSRITLVDGTNVAVPLSPDDVIKELCK